MTDAPRTFDRILDDFDLLWQHSQSPPSLITFLERARSAGGQSQMEALAFEAALIDLEHRWRRFFGKPASCAAENGRHAQFGLPELPEWSDYAQLLGSADFLVPGICHEFRVRQLFGDRPDFHSFCQRYASEAATLLNRLPELAAELTRATVKAFWEDKFLLSSALPSRLEIGRRRVSEPPAPCVVSNGIENRLVIAEKEVVRLSRVQLRIEVLARGRVGVRNCARKGDVVVGPFLNVGAGSATEVDLPCFIRFKGWLLRLE